MTVYAIVKTLEAGYDCDKKQMQDLDIKVGDRFKVTRIDMSQSSTSISLEGSTDHFNSVFFSFEENDEPLDIYSDTRFNPYLEFFRRKG